MLSKSILRISQLSSLVSFKPLVGSRLSGLMTSLPTDSAGEEEIVFKEKSDELIAEESPGELGAEEKHEELDP